MKEKIIIDGKMLLMFFVAILLLTDFFVRTINIWLENSMLRQKFNYKEERRNEVYKYLNKESKGIIENIKKVFDSWREKIRELKRKIAKRLILQEITK